MIDERPTNTSHTTVPIHVPGPACIVSHWRSTASNVSTTLFLSRAPKLRQLPLVSRASPQPWEGQYGSFRMRTRLSGHDAWHSLASLSWLFGQVSPQGPALHLINTEAPCTSSCSQRASTSVYRYRQSGTNNVREVPRLVLPAVTHWCSLLKLRHCHSISSTSTTITHLARLPSPCLSLLGNC